MTADIPSPVQQVLQEYMSLVQQTLPGMLVGLYLQGSLALGAYNDGLSDIDFIAITSRRCTTTDIAVLRMIHQRVAQHYPSRQMEGCYLQWADLGQFEDTIPPHPYAQNGILRPRGYHDN